jgi:hypothetical protein
MKWNTAKSILSIGLCAVIAVFAIVSSQQNTKLRVENQKLQAELATAQQTALQQSSSGEISSEQRDRSRGDTAEVLKLRGELAVLQRELADITKLAHENLQLQQQIRAITENKSTTDGADEPKPLSDAEKAARQIGVAKMNFMRDWIIAFQNYATQNQGQMPSNFEQARAYLPPEFNSTLDPNSFELAYHGSLSQIREKGLQAAQIIVIREGLPTTGPSGKRYKAYGFGDGHCEIREEPAEGFDDWEKSRTLTAP